MQGQIAGAIRRPILKGASCRGNRAANIQLGIKLGLQWQDLKLSTTYGRIGTCMIL
jgi:hypothetical protein